MHRLVDHALGQPQRPDLVVSFGKRHKYPAAPSGLAVANVVTRLSCERMKGGHHVGHDRGQIRQVSHNPVDTVEPVSESARRRSFQTLLL